MVDYLSMEGHFGNPASTTHEYGRQAALAVEHARAQIAEAIHAQPQDLVFTSGATESNNLALLALLVFIKIKASI